MYLLGRFKTLADGHLWNCHCHQLCVYTEAWLGGDAQASESVCRSEQY